MTPLIADIPVCAGATEAGRLARQNWRANSEALARRHQPAPEPTTSAEKHEWVFARDGHLTCFDTSCGGERWFAGCSVPLLAARAMLKSLDGSAGVACFLTPAHAAQVRVALDHLRGSHALFCVVPEARALRLMLHCSDFSADIASGRLWFASGEFWTDSLARTLATSPGLPTPTRFIRMPNADGGQIDRLIAEAQSVFTDQNTRRTAAIAALRDQWSPRAVAFRGARRVCVIARSNFRLWDDAGNTLYAAVTATAAEGTHPDIDWRRLDPDDPAGCSHLAVAAAAAESGAVVAADMARADAPRLVPDALPWITWVTTRRIPPFAAAGPNDRLLFADADWREAALRSGWPCERVGTAGWPIFVATPAADPFVENASQPLRTLAMIADTSGLDAPASLAEFSSHGLLWEKIRNEVLRDPFSLPSDVVAYLRSQARLEGIAEETFDLALFADRLIIPAYQQALADALLTAGLPLRLHGGGWQDLPRFRPFAAGPIKTHRELHDAVRDVAALVHAWPTTGAHPIDALGRPVLRRTGVRKESFLRDARLALAGTAAAPARPAGHSIAAAQIIHALSATGLTPITL